MIGQNDSANFLPYHFALSFFKPWLNSGSIPAQFWLNSGSEMAQLWLKYGSILVQIWSKSGSMAIPAWFKLVQLVQMANGGSTHLARFGGSGSAYGYEKSV